jgi:hypothetical protein
MDTRQKTLADLATRTEFNAGTIWGVQLHYAKMYRVLSENRFIAEWHDDGTRWISEENTPEVRMVQLAWGMA